MKQQRTFLLAAIAAMTVGLTSCKKENTNADGTSGDTIVTTEPDATMIEPDTVQAPPVNDSNTSGTTSGEMEQVP
ncbi:hypothetical protein [Flavobacterium selenitireducens]|uniref:hypothetical protein n=1 Tax=Flavobacterium selenitireducens TaxID=2722704 RepID=UPI00168BF44D|nr:hypothetical protein [Flavobacterium selenitireducens]MBD3583845.1 hypothetical protein [Flavobacterium selenitireducens]